MELRKEQGAWSIATRPLFALLLILMLAAGLAGCGGGGGNQGDPAPPPGAQVTISGHAVNDAVADGTVRLETQDGRLLGQASTDSEGAFAIQATEADIADGYQLVVTGGQVRDRPFSGELRARYAGTENRSAANVTLLTTLVSRMAELEASGPTLQRRDMAVQRMTDLGAIESDQWNAVEPAGVALESLRVAIAERGFDDVLDVLASQLMGGEFSEGLLEFFPNMFGGVVALAFGDDRNRISDFAGTSGSVEVQPIVTSTESYRFALEAGPGWLTVDPNTGAFTYAIPDGTPPGQLVPFSIRVTNNQTGFGRSIQAAVFVVGAETLAEGIVGPEGGAVMDAWGEVVIDVEAGSAAVPTRFLIIRGRDAEGNVMLSLRIEGDPDVQYRLLLPDPEVMDANTPSGLAPSMLEPQSVQSLRSVAPMGSIHTTSAHHLSDPIPNLVDRGFSWYFSRTNKRVPYGRFSPPSGESNFISNLTRNFTARTSWELWGPPGQVIAEPVLFIHGYQGLNSLGGGSSTWENFMPLVANLNGGGTYQPYEFRWRTDARFQDVAVDLAVALQRISTDTERRVHVIAHSFGGIVVRSFLQGLATIDVANVIPSVASVTTVGTPHSGIFGSAGGNRNNIQFPDGRDGWIAACGQISCYQMGDTIDWTTLRPDAREALGLESEPGFISQRLVDTENSLPNIPIQVLIGLTADRFLAGGLFVRVAEGGDGLISFSGQRFRPDLGEHSELLNQTFGQAHVRERLLGYDEDRPQIVPGVRVDSLFTTGRWLSSSYIAGYRHANNNNFWRGSARQVGIGCSSAIRCWHDVWLKTRDFLAAVQAQVFTPTRFTVNGVVRDTSGRGIGGVRLAFAAGGLSGGSATTDANGNFSASLVFSPDTQYSVSAYPLMGSGYRAVTSTGTLTTGATPGAAGNTFPAITLVGGQPVSATLAGEILDAQTGNLLANVQYRVVNSLGFEVGSGLSSNGRVLISDLPPGTYRLQASASGYRSGENPTCTVETLQTTICTLSLSVSLSVSVPTTVLYISGQGFGAPALGGIDTVSVDPQTGAVRDTFSSRLPCCGFSDVEYVDGKLYGIEDYGSSLYEIDLELGMQVRVGGTGAICINCGLIGHDGKLYQVDFIGDVFEINLSSGFASPINFRLPLGGEYAFDDNGMLWGIAGRQIYQIDFVTGAISEERLLSAHPYNIDAITFTTEGLVGIDRFGGVLLRIDLATGLVTPFAIVQAQLAAYKGITSN